MRDGCAPPQNVTEAVEESEVSIVCVGTPSLESGRLNLDFVRKVSLQLVDAIRAKDGPHTIHLPAASMLPGSTQSMVQDFFQPLCGSRAGQHLLLSEVPARGARRCAISANPPSVWWARMTAARPPAWSPGAAGRAVPRSWPGRGAETIKYACNYFYALKVGFANEIGRISKHLGVDGARIMDVVCRDERLNISRYYMKPGNPLAGPACRRRERPELLRPDGGREPAACWTMC